MKRNIWLLLSISLFSFSFSSNGLAAFSAANTPKDSSLPFINSKPIIAYFDSIDNENSYIEQPNENGFYRVLLGQNAHGHYLIQDFFQDTAQAQTEPYWIVSAEGLTSFGIEYIQGPLIGYFKNGNTSFKGDLQKGEYLKPFESFYPSGTLANRTSQLALGYLKDEYFYKDGQKAIIFEYNDEGERIHTQAWDQNGIALNTQQADDLEAEILEQIRFDR